jgi:hypothetical protein
VWPRKKKVWSGSLGDHRLSAKGKLKVCSARRRIGRQFGTGAGCLVRVLHAAGRTGASGSRAHAAAVAAASSCEKVLFVGNQLTTPSNRLIAENGLHRRHAVEMETERKSRRRCIMFMSPSSVEARPIDLRVLRPATRSTRPDISSPTGGASNACSNTRLEDTEMGIDRSLTAEAATVVVGRWMDPVSNHPRRARARLDKPRARIQAQKGTFWPLRAPGAVVRDQLARTPSEQHMGRPWDGPSLGSPSCFFFGRHGHKSHGWLRAGFIKSPPFRGPLAEGDHHHEYC